MTFKRIAAVSILLFQIVTLPVAAQSRDLAGSQDSPLVSRYPGSVIGRYVSKEFDAFAFPVGAVTAKGAPKSLHLEGRITRIEYTNPKGRSSLEIYRNYEGALKRAGFEVVFSCSGDACGVARFHMTEDWADLWYGAGHYQFSGKLARPEGDLYVSLHVAPDTTNLDLIETSPMEGGLVTVDAAALKGDLGKAGHVAVYGITFDTARAEVRAESAAALLEVSKLLQTNPRLRLYVVGHTDNVGSAGANLELSRRRAMAVVNALTEQYRVAAERLQAYGAGPYAPVSANESESGRALNRRVERVKQ